MLFLHVVVNHKRCVHVYTSWVTFSNYTVHFKSVVHGEVVNEYWIIKCSMWIKSFRPRGATKNRVVTS